MTSLSLNLRIETQAEPMTGCISDAHGIRVSFSGWLGLAAALERLIADAAARPCEERARCRC